MEYSQARKLKIMRWSQPKSALIISGMRIPLLLCLLVLCSRDAVSAVSDTSMNRVTILDGRRRDYTTANPLPVTQVNNPVGASTVRQTTTTTDLAANTTVNHDYTNSGSTAQRVKQVQVASSGLIKVIFKTGATCAGATDIGFTSFNQTGENIWYEPKADLDLPAGHCFRFTILNREADPQNVYSTYEALQLP